MMCRDLHYEFGELRKGHIGNDPLMNTIQGISTFRYRFATYEFRPEGMRCPKHDMQKCFWYVESCIHPQRAEAAKPKGNRRGNNPAPYEWWKHDLNTEEGKAVLKAMVKNACLTAQTIISSAAARF
jgi:hypothetical protein